MRSLLKEFNELENQEIFFSAVDGLNDPMEGFFELVWAGDDVVWKNWLKHYVYCFFETSHIAAIAGADFDKTVLDDLIFQSYADLPEAPIRESFDRVFDKILNRKGILRFLRDASSRKEVFHSKEIAQYIRFIHIIVLSEVFIYLSKKKLIQSGSSLNSICARRSMLKFANNADRSLSELSKYKIIGDEKYRELHIVSDSIYNQINILQSYNNGPFRDKILEFLSRDFQDQYVMSMEKLIFPPWYVACFSDNPSNASMWGVYGDGHRGACLVFKERNMIEGRPSLRINLPVSHSFNGNSHKTNYNFVDRELHKVSYTDGYPQIDLFRSIARMPFDRLMRAWYRGDDGTVSSCASELINNEDGWRENYWKLFEQCYLRKLPDWSHEGEYRIVLNGSFNDLSDTKSRKVIYNFDDLEGIIFGSRASFEDKIAIMKIIDKKCILNDRKDFKFYQSAYSSSKRSFIVLPLDLIRHSSAASK